jgi:sugar lactone lactonase YvrE/uncharacterized membrane protein YphA (DoxX/SURF4 family)
MNLIASLLQILVGVAFIGLGVAKVIGLASISESFLRLRLPSWLRYVIGPVEVVGGACMLMSVMQPFLAFFVAVLLVMILVGALAVHFIRGPRDGWPVAAGLLAATLAIIGLQPLGLRVLALPAADILPVEAVASFEVLKTYAPGAFLESIKVAPDGSIYLTANKGIYLQTGDKSKTEAQVIVRAPDGAERILFKLPPGATAGVMAFGADGTLFLTGDGSALGVWRISPSGKGELFAKLPEGSWPNGLTLGPDGMLYAADSLLGKIWKIDPRTGQITTAIENDLLRRRFWIALAPGANGLHFFGRDLFVSVSDRGTILRFKQTSDGKFQKPEVYAVGIPSDDFAIDSDGALYVTTHPHNTIVKITPDGRRIIIANAQHGVTGAADAAFGTRTGDEQTLYVATDGGAFGGDPEARGALVALNLNER